MSMLFSDNNVDIDEKVFNLGRISRVCGYYNRKGSPLDKKDHNVYVLLLKYLTR